MAAFKQLYMFGFGRFYMYVDACFGVVLLLLSVVLGTAWDYLSCLPFNFDSTKKKKNTSFEISNSVCYDLHGQSVMSCSCNIQSFLQNALVLVF